MKATLRKLTLTCMASLGFMLVTSAAEASSAKATCKVVTHDVGTITGKGVSRADAFEDAATQCFERRASKYRTVKNVDIDEEVGLTLIDTCANLTCG